MSSYPKGPSAAFRAFAVAAALSALLPGCAAGLIGPNCTFANKVFTGVGKIAARSATALDGSWNGATTTSHNVWTFVPGSTTKTALTSASGGAVPNTQGAVISPDGTKILFVSTVGLAGNFGGAANPSSNVWIINVDGTGLTALTQNTAGALSSIDARFSPDGTKVVFLSFTALDGSWNGTATSSNNVWVMNVDGTNRVPITKNTVVLRGSLYPSFSPDGTKVVFQSLTNLDGTWDGAGSASYNIWIAGADGTQRTPLTLDTNSGLDNTVPMFSPDGKRIVYASLSDSTTIWNGASSLSKNIWTIAADGSARVGITHNTVAGRDSTTPAYHPDGTKIVFVSQTALDGSWNGTATTAGNIWTVKTDGSSLAALTQNLASGDSSLPSFSPDGLSIVFASRMDVTGIFNGSQTVQYNLWTMKSDGTSLRALTQNTGAGPYQTAPTALQAWYQPYYCAQ